MAGVLRRGLSQREKPGDQLHLFDFDHLVASLKVLYTKVCLALDPQRGYCVQQHSSISRQQRQQLQTAPVLLASQHAEHTPSNTQHSSTNQPHKFHGVIATCRGPDGGGHAGAIAAISQQLSQYLEQQGSLLQQTSAVHKQVQQPRLELQKHVQQPVLPTEQLLSVLKSVSQLEKVPSELLHTLADATVHMIPQMAPSQLAEALEALGALPSSLQYARHALPRALTSYLRQNQHQFDAAGTIAVAEALVKCEHHGSFTVLSMLAMDHIYNMTAQQLVLLLTAFGHAQHHNDAVMGAACKLVIDFLAQQAYRLYPSSFDNITAAGAAQAQQCVPASLQPKPLDKGRGVTADQLKQVLRVCRSLRHHDAQLLEAAATAAVRSVKHLELQQIVHIVITCAEMNHYSTSLFEEACRLAQQVIANQQHGRIAESSSVSSSPPQIGKKVALHGSANSINSLLTGLAWSCALMNHLDVPFWQQLAAYSSGMDVQQLSEGELLRWFQVQSCLTDAAISNPELRSLSLSNHLLLAAQGAWLKRLQGQSLTAFHKDVHEALKQAGAKCRLNVALDGPLVVDLALQKPPFRHRVAVQLETPDMFAANPPHTALGPTAARWRALQARGWQVVSLRYSDWSRLKTVEEKVLYMYNIKEAVAVRAPGLAPDVVQAGAIAQQSRHSGQQALKKKLWKLLGN